MLDIKQRIAELDLKDPSLLETRALVNGVWISKDRTFPVLNPAIGECIAHVADLDVADTAAAIDAAYAARTDWAR